VNESRYIAHDQYKFFCTYSQSNPAMFTAYRYANITCTRFSCRYIKRLHYRRCICRLHKIKVRDGKFKIKQTGCTIFTPELFSIFGFA